MRTAAGMFDLSHMAEITVYRGPQAAAVPGLRAEQSPLGDWKTLQAKYSLLLSPTRAGLSMT